VPSLSTAAGKSSILHAIQVVFGSRASDTSRGSKLADLIHHGREEAVIEVLVKNEGDGAFKHEQYGDTIAIVKKIRRNGAGITRVLNHATGAEVSRSPSEVAELCAHFNILVSNPCVIMTQEVSKKFLQSKKAEDKYTFFLQATQLEWLRASLADSKHQIEQMDHTVAPLGERILELVKDMQDLQSVGLGHRNAQLMFNMRACVWLISAWAHVCVRVCVCMSCYSVVRRLWHRKPTRCRMTSTICSFCARGVRCWMVKFSSIRRNMHGMRRNKTQKR
jgi:hypothetical protein